MSLREIEAEAHQRYLEQEDLDPLSLSWRKNKSASHKTYGGGSVCCVLGCDSTKDRVKLFAFSTKDLEQRELWIKAVNRVNPDGSIWRPKLHSRVCSRHFTKGTPSLARTHPDYVPSIFPSDVVQVRGLERLEPVHPDLGAASQLVSVDTQTDPCLEKDPFQFWWECDFDGGSAATGCALPGNGSLQLSRRCAEAPLSKTSKKTLSCLDPDCGNDSLNFPNLGFFALPKDPVIRRRWGKAIPLNWRKRFRSKDQSIRLCAVHFDPRDFVDPEEKKELKLTAVPSWKQPEESRPQLNSTIHGVPTEIPALPQGQELLDKVAETRAYIARRKEESKERFRKYVDSYKCKSEEERKARRAMVQKKYRQKMLKITREEKMAKQRLEKAAANLFEVSTTLEIPEELAQCSDKS